MNSPTCLIPCIHHEWENIEINDFNWSLTKVIQRSFGKCDFALNIFQKPSILDLAIIKFLPTPKLVRISLTDDRIRKKLPFIHAITTNVNVTQRYNERFFWIKNLPICDKTCQRHVSMQPYSNNESFLRLLTIKILFICL